MKKKLVIILLVVLLCGTSVFVIYKFNTEKENFYETKKNVNTTNEKESLDNEKNKGDEVKQNLINEETSNNTNQETQKSKPTTEPKQEEIKVETNNNSDNNVTKKENVVSNPSKEEPIKETVKKGPWDDLGISESDYYNKPMWSWAKLDFKLSDYGTQDKTMQACRDYGNKIAQEQGLGFSCTTISSYSGNYLGEMLQTF